MIDKIQIKVQDKIELSIDMSVREIAIEGYEDSCVMLIRFPKRWAYSRAVQHAMTIAHASIEAHKIL